MGIKEKGSGFIKGSGIILVIVLQITLFMGASGFAGGPGTTGATFLKLGVGSRPVAMGEAYVAVSDDVNSLYWNPAGLATVTGRQMSFVHTEWFQSIRYEYLGYCQPMLGGVLGASGTFLWVDGIEQRGYTDPTGETIERYIPSRDLAVTVSYGKTLSKKLNLGATLKIIYQQLDDKTATGVALDLGMLYNLGKEKWTLGASLQNLGYESAFISEASSLPMNLKIGISNKYLEDKLTIAADINYGIMDSVWSIAGGIDWWVHPMFAIRGGYKYNSAISSLGPLAGLTIGGGFKYNIFNIDYAFVPYGDLGYTHRISLLAKF